MNHFYDTIIGYQANKEKDTHVNQTSTLISASILAGIRACRLAEIVLGRNPDKNLRRLALDVLRDFGISFEEDNDATEDTACLWSAPESPPPAAEEVLHWPPPKPTLPMVYRSNLYEVRSTGAAALVDNGSLILESGTNLIFVESGTNLIFDGASEWWQNAWLMRFTVLGSPDEKLWLKSHDVRPTDEEVVPSPTESSQAT